MQAKGKYIDINLRRERDGSVSDGAGRGGFGSPRVQGFPLVIHKGNQGTT